MLFMLVEIPLIIIYARGKFSMSEVPGILILLLNIIQNNKIMSLEFHSNSKMCMTEPQPSSK